MDNKEYAHIPGWGIDADPKNDPTYPIRHRTDQNGEFVGPRGNTWERPSQQPIDIEVLRSIERPTVSAVFGTSVPPSGLSGQLRRLAFKSSESEYGHWLPLLLADRINVVEGIVDDLRQGRVPNIIAEKGWKAGWKYNRTGILQSILIGAAVTTVTIALLSRNKSTKN